MKKFQKVFMALVLCVSFLATSVFFAGCGNTQTATGSASDTTKAADTAKTSEAAKDTAGAAQVSVPDVAGVKIKDVDAGGTLKGQYAGKKVVIGTKQGEMENGLKAIAPYFEQVSGAKVEINAFPDASFMDKVQLDLASGHNFDVVCMPVAFVHGYAESGFLQEISKFTKDAKIASPNFDQGDFIPSLLEVYGMYKGTFYALPFKPDAQVFFYRKDLFGDDKVKAAFKAKVGKDLKVPETIDELYETAKFFTKSMNPDSPVKYGYNMMGNKGSSRWPFKNSLAVFGGKELDANLAPGFNNEAGVKAMSVYLELAKYCAPEWKQFVWDTANNFFAQGDVAMMEQWPGLSKVCETEGSKVKGKVGFAVTPGKAPALGGWSVALTKASKNPELGYKFMEYVTSKDMELVKIASGNDPCRTSNYKRPEIAASNPMYPVLGESLAAAKILADFDVPYISAKLNDIEETAVNSVISGKATPAEAIKAMADSVTKEIKAANLAK